jgi:hypothetical protein
MTRIPSELIQLNLYDVGLHRITFSKSHHTLVQFADNQDAGKQALAGSGSGPLQYTRIDFIASFTQL